MVRRKRDWSSRELPADGVPTRRGGRRRTRRNKIFSASGCRFFAVESFFIPCRWGSAARLAFRSVFGQFSSWDASRRLEVSGFTPGGLRSIDRVRHGTERAMEKKKTKKKGNSTDNSRFTAVRPKVFHLKLSFFFFFFLLILNEKYLITIAGFYAFVENLKIEKCTECT